MMTIEYLPSPGTPADQLDTPVLIVDLDKAESNIKTLQSNADSMGVAVRPHVKTHKSAFWAMKQIDAGAIGICAAKLGEAEAMVDGGIKDVLIANEIVGSDKIKRLVLLAKRAKITVAVDDSENIMNLSQATTLSGVKIGVLVDVNVRLDRCGVEAGSQTVELAEKIEKAQNLEFLGLMAYEGHIPPGEQGRKENESALEKLETAYTAVESQGLDIAVVSGAGTSTYQLTGKNSRVTEIQCGTYIFMDGAYKEESPEFQPALTLMGRVISKPVKDRAVTDIGMKSASVDSGLPLVVGMPGVELTKLSEEHGTLALSGEGLNLKINDRVNFIPMHGDTTINIHSHYFCVRGGVLENVVPISARGLFR